jgi:D-aminopeptidase
MIIVATDAALDARQLARVARRAVFALGRVGSDFGHGSGDYAIAFATGCGPAVADAELNPVFAAAQESVEEAVLNSLLMAATTAGHLGHVRYAVPHDYLLDACRRA